MPSFNSKFLDNFPYSPRIVKLVSKIAEHKGKQELYASQKTEKLKALKESAIIQSVESSNRLEGVVAPKKRFEALMQNKTEPQNRSEGEIAGYRDVLRIIHDSAADIPFSDSIVLQFHRDLMKYTATDGGHWKVTDNTIEEKHPDGTRFVRFEPTPAHLAPEAMLRLHADYQTAVKQKNYDPVILIGLYILDFLCIHPFLDGNGRMVRLLSLLALYHQGYEVGRYISLERLVENTKESYYEVLYKSSQGWHESKHDPLPWIEYWLGIVQAGYEEMEQRMQEMNTAYGGKTDLVIMAINRKNEDFSIADLKKECPSVTADWIQKIVYQFRDDGKLELVGHGRGAKWRKKH